MTQTSMTARTAKRELAPKNDNENDSCVFPILVMEGELSPVLYSDPRNKGEKKKVGNVSIASPTVVIANSDVMVLYRVQVTV